MKTTRHTILLASHHQAAIDRLAAEQHVSFDVLAAQVLSRMMTDPDYLHAIEAVLRKMVPLRAFSSIVWPVDPLDSLACSLYLAFVVELEVDKQLLSMPEQELARLDAEVKRTGRSMEELMGAQVLSEWSGPAKR